MFADRIVGKPYLEFDLDRNALARYGLSVREVQDIIEVAVGGRTLTTTVEGRERYPVRVRYLRELRNDIESLEDIMVPTRDGAQVPIIQLADLRYVRGPQVIKSEDTFLVGYVLFDKKPGFGEVDVVEAARDRLEALRESGEFSLPPGVSYSFAGSYENQVRSEKRMRVVLPVALFIIFMILYFQFRRVPTTLHGLLRGVRGLGRRVRHDLALRPALVPLLGSVRRFLPGSVPDRPHEPERGGVGRVPGPVRDRHRQRGHHGHLSGPGSAGAQAEDDGRGPEDGDICRSASNPSPR